MLIATQIFIEHQALLQRTAYSIVGCKKDAEDLVQDTFEKWIRLDYSSIQNAKAYLLSMLKNACLNFLTSFRKTREISFGTPLELFKNRYEEIDLRLFDFETDLTTGVSDLLQRLTLPEFSTLLLKEGFEFDYSELSETLGKKLEHCRQLLSRAKKKRNKRAYSFPLNIERRNQIVKEITAIYNNGNIQNLVAYLQKELRR